MLVAALALLLALPAAAADRDALGQPLSLQARADYDALLASWSGRRLSDTEKDFLLALLNSPELDAGTFRGRRELIRHFLASGVALGPAGSGLEKTDLWRLVRAARAASDAFEVPPAILLCLTFRESSFNARASGWTTSAKGVAQLTNATVSEVVSRARSDPWLAPRAEAYARALGATLPDAMVGAPDVDALNVEIQRLRENGVPREAIREREAAKRRAIASHKDEPGHIFNMETNFGLGAAYLAYLRHRRFAEVAGEEAGWLTAVAAYNQGPGVANQLVYKVYAGPADYNAQPLDAVWSAPTAARLRISPERQREMLGEVGSVRGCAVP